MNIGRQIYQYIRFAFFCLLLSIATGSMGQRTEPKFETRAVWLTTLSKLDWPKTNATSPASMERQKEELRQTLDKLKKAGINTVMLQTRVRATAIYPSAYEPWDMCLTGTTDKNPGYDPLAFAIEECHKRGMELHAWIVTIPVGKWNSEGCKRLRKKMPSLIKKIGDEGFMNPEKKETGDYIAKICSEVVSNYDVDGIHLDYIRYPEKWRFNVSKQKGRNHITDIVKKINFAIKSKKEWIKLTCSPIGKYDNLARYSSKGWNAKSRVCQDAQEWLRTNLMDGLYPMMYFSGNDFYPFAIDWKEQSHGKTIVSGLGIYFMRDKNWPLEEIKRQMEVSRNHGLGHAYFRSQFLTDNLKGIYNFASNDFDSYPALVPPMTWQSDTKPLAPSEINISRFAHADHLSWNDGKDNSNGDYLLYNIYASREFPVDINNPRNLVATRLRCKDVTFNHKENYTKNINYAVTAIDRYGNESEPVYTKNGGYIEINDTIEAPLASMFSMPSLPNNLDASHVIIENNKKEIILISPYSRTIDISTLRDGVYTIRTMGKKAVTHRVGWLKLYRDNNRIKRYSLTTVWKK